MNTSPNPPRESLIIRLSTHLPLLEKIFVGVLCLGILLKYVNINGRPLIYISLAGLAVVFYFFSFRPVEIEHEEDGASGFMDLFVGTIAPKLLGISSAVSILGILFYLMNFGNNGYKQMLMIGGSTTFMASLVLGFASVTGTKNIDVNLPILYRAIPLMAIDVYLFL